MSNIVDVFSNRHRIERWLRALLAEDAQTKPDQLSLRHVSVSDRQADVATFAIGEKAPKKAADDYELLIGRIDDALENDADGLGGVQKYVLLALKDGRALSRLPIRVAASGDESGNGESMESEPANSQGLLAQLMRHNEVQSRMFAMSMGQVVTTMQRTIARLQESVELADDRRLAAVGAAEEMLTQKHEREAITQMVEDKRVTTNTVFATVGKVMPLVMQYLRNATGLSGEDAPLVKLLTQLASSLNTEQLLGLQRLLTPEQLELINRIFAAAPTGETEEQSKTAEGADGQ